MGEAQPAGGPAAGTPAVVVRRSGLLSPGTATALGALVLVLLIGTLTLKGFAHQLTGSGTWSGIAMLLHVHTPVAVAASTLAAAALFSPLRVRVQHIVDRRFNRARYDADQTVAAFAARLKDAVDLDSASDDLARVVQQALEPAHVSVWTSRGP